MRNPLYKHLMLTTMVALCFLFSPHKSSATHYMGGEITWECTPQGNFRFTMILYRECYTVSGGNAATFGQTIQMQTNVPGFPTIQMNRISLEDMSPTCECPGGLNIFCSGMPGASANMGAMQENVYTSDQAYPNGVPLTGVPLATGWHFSYGVCCRNPCNNILNTQSLQFRVRAFMYPYQNTPVDNCFDNSPSFLEGPSHVFCTGMPTSFNHMAYDADGDSLVFDWAEPLQHNINTPLVSYFAGYSWNSPLPDTMHHPNNVPASLDPHTGEISFTSYTNGAFVKVTKVSSYRNGVLIAEVFREIQVVVLPCDTNNTPTAAIYSMNHLPLTEISPGHYQMTVHPGDTVACQIAAIDPDLCNDQTTPQDVLLYATGNHFGTPVNPTPCADPPCATLTPSPSPGTPLSAPTALTTLFEWPITIDHLEGDGLQYFGKAYNYHFTIRDNFCPVPASRNIMLTVGVQPHQWMDSLPEILCLEVQQYGDVMITWNPATIDTNAFDSYTLKGSTLHTGPFVTLDQFSNMQQNTYTHVGSTSLSQPNYYNLYTNTLVPVLMSTPSKQITSTIYLQAITGYAHQETVTLSWNPTHYIQLPQSASAYQIFRREGTGSWQLIDTTINTHYTDTMQYQNQQVYYRVEFTVAGMSGTSCISRSNTASVFLNSTDDLLHLKHTPVIYPNPAQHQIVITPGELSGAFGLKMYHSNGQLVSEWNKHFEQGVELNLKLPNVAPGLYLMLFTHDAGTYSTRLMVTQP